MKRIGTFLCGMAATFFLTGCGAMPDLTQEETELISEYAAGILLKYDTNNISRLVDTSAYDVETESDEMTEEVEEQQEEQPDIPVNDTEVIDVSQDGETAETIPSTIESYYGIQDITFQYTGYELADSYPSTVEGEELFFTMDATEGTDLLVLKFTAANTSGDDVTLNMLEHGARFRISVNGEASKGALATMLLNDMQTYDNVVPADSSIELISIVEVPEGTGIDSIEFILRGNEEDATMVLE